MDWTVAILVFVLIIGGVVIAYFLFQQNEQRKLMDRLKTYLAEARVREEQLRQTEEQLRQTSDEAVKYASWIRTLFNHTQDMILVFELDGEGLPGLFLEANEEACSRLKYTPAEFQGMTLLDIESLDTQFSTGYNKADLGLLSDQYTQERSVKLARREAQRLMKEVREKGHLSVERILRDKNEQNIPVEMRLQFLDVAAKPQVILTAKDVSDRKEAEVALRESRQRFLDFFTHAPIGIAVYGAQRELIDVNSACLKMFGVPDRDAFAHFNIFSNPYLQQDTRKNLDQGESVREELSIDFSEAVRDAVIISARTGKAHLDLSLNRMGPGHDFRPRGYFALIQDITDKRVAEHELKKQTEKMLQSEKTEAIGTMASSIAHDFNNVLTPIIGYVKMILRVTREEEPINVFAQGIEQASLRAKDLVAQIMTFARKADTQKEAPVEPIRIIPIAREVMSMQRQVQPEEVEISVVIKTEQDVVVIDPTQLHQVLTNLCTNAGYAMRATQGGSLELLITDFVVDPRTKTDYPSLKPRQRYIKLSIRDTGPGMEPAILSRIFEPFFTTKKKGEGTGIGLSVVQGIIRSAKGALRVESEVGKGSTFHIVLPVVDEKLLQNHEVANKNIPQGSERVLVIDDESEVTGVVSHMLTTLGYKPVGAGSAAEALDLFLADPTQFDAMLTDQTMPGMTGLELARKVLAVRPELPILLMTANREDIPPGTGEPSGIRKIINKPIFLSDLAESMRVALDSPPKPKPVVSESDHTGKKNKAERASPQ